MGDASQPRGRSIHRVLLVETNPILSEGLRTLLLHDFPDFRIDTAANCNEALQMVDGNSPTIVLVDIDSRGCEEFATFNAVRRRVPGALFVALSLYPVQFFRDSAIAAGADACACIAQADDMLCDLVRRVLHLPRRLSS